ncbi:hypothetical protein M404DRAFT_1000368 [Pisolithus tinctorius Marx 270]|uniref:Uncharacterized protein n=1 Tax=Pisolithus tinctorius Marx 270 TaxID=870435 RepID=A0A0C3K5L2_PISTI|nr:hypothetical protein M404DRAFT_1000368 [Pisolithus tinctorius Marx 270]
MRNWLEALWIRKRGYLDNGCAEFYKVCVPRKGSARGMNDQKSERSDAELPWAFAQKCKYLWSYWTNLNNPDINMEHSSWTTIFQKSERHDAETSKIRVKYPENGPIHKNANTSLTAGRMQAILVPTES